MGLTIGLGASPGGSNKKTIFDLDSVEVAVKIKQADRSITEIPLVDTSKVTDMYQMFYMCSKLKTVPLLDTSKVTNMDSMFYYCYALEEVPNFNTSKVTNMSNMFYYCSNIKTIPLLDMSNVSRASNMFSNCSSLEHVPELDVSKISNTYMSSFLSNTSSLKTCLLIGLKESLEIHFSQNLEKSSVLHIFNHAQTITTAKTIKLHKNVFNQLTADEIAIATQKGFSVVST